MDLSQEPAGVSPPGVKSNLHATATQAPIFFAIGGFLLFATLSLMATRTYAKLQFIRTFDLDDGAFFNPYCMCIQS
jgi:hypothetical protein